MANEATCRERHSNVNINFHVAEGSSFEKGTICKLSGGRAAIASSADGDIFAGIVVREGIASDTRNQIALARDGIWDLKASSGTIAAGDNVKISGANLIATADDDVAEHMSQAFGIALEAADADEVIQVLLTG